jgi:hypothetical protein
VPTISEDRTYGKQNDISRVWTQRIEPTFLMQVFGARYITTWPPNTDPPEMDILAVGEGRGPPSHVDQTMHRAKRRGMVDRAGLD